MLVSVFDSVIALECPHAQSVFQYHRILFEQPHDHIATQMVPSQDPSPTDLDVGTVTNLGRQGERKKAKEREALAYE